MSKESKSPNPQSLKFIFLVQGEGRGHMTQAIALAQHIRSQGHTLKHVFIGGSDRRKVPDFFKDNIHATTDTIPSPNFELDKENKSLRIIPSIFNNLLKAKKYLRSIASIKKVIKAEKPDVFVNFYDLLGGLYFHRYTKGRLKYVCIGHQYLAKHPDFPFADGRKSEKLSYLLLNRLTHYKADKILALSFTAYTPFKNIKLEVVPPLLREEIRFKDTKEENYILAYVVNDGYGEEIKNAHAFHKNEKLHCFWDNRQMPDGYSPHKNITFHQLNGHLFMDMMSNARSYICTAGFESVCEAMYLGKRIMVVPVQNHYEQACNALDAVKTGLCIASDSFDLQPLIAFNSQRNYHEKQEIFKSWVDKANEVFESVFNDLVK